MNSEKIAFITGASKGIGLETARKLAKEGVQVVIGSRSEKGGLDAVQQLKSEGLKVDYLLHDVTKQADNQKVHNYFLDKFGKLDILINNAGILLDSENASVFIPNNAETVSGEILKNTFDTNFFAQIELTQQLLPLLKKSPAGRIVNLSSILGSLTLHSDPSSPIYSSKLLAYNASKAALNVFTIHLAHALQETSVKVNSVHPGWVRSAMGGEKASIDVEEGSNSSVKYALIEADGPNGGFFYLDDILPW